MSELVSGCGKIEYNAEFVLSKNTCDKLVNNSYYTLQELRDIHGQPLLFIDTTSKSNDYKIKKWKFIRW